MLSVRMTSVTMVVPGSFWRNSTASITATSAGYIKWIVVTVPTGRYRYARFRKICVATVPKTPYSAIFGRLRSLTTGGLRRMQPARNSRIMPQLPRPTISVATDMDSFVASLISAVQRPYKSAEAVANAAPLKRVFPIFPSPMQK